MTIANKIYEIWIASDANLEVHSSGNEFIAEIRAGEKDETIISVGYSNPNGADIRQISYEQILVMEERLEEYWNAKGSRKPLKEMLPVLFELCVVANDCFNSSLKNK